MKLLLLFVVPMCWLVGCKVEDEFVVPSSSSFKCEKSILKSMLVTEDSKNKTQIDVVNFDFFYPLRALAGISRSIRRASIINIKAGKGIDAEKFIKDGADIIRYRKDSILTVNYTDDVFKVRDPRMFLMNGDLILLASRGCSYETGAVYDNNLDIKYFFTFAQDIVTSGNNKKTGNTTFSFSDNDESVNYYYFNIFDDSSFAPEDTDLVVDKIKVKDGLPVPLYKLQRNETLSFKFKDDNFKVFEMIDTPYFVHKANIQSKLFVADFSLKNNTDMRRAVAFSFLKNQIELENDIDKNLFNYKEANHLRDN